LCCLFLHLSLTCNNNDNKSAFDYNFFLYIVQILYVFILLKRIWTKNCFLYILLKRIWTKYFVFFCRSVLKIFFVCLFFIYKK
jgi:hypothetical protein